MKIYADVQQGSDQWLHLRLGRPTASEFHRIVTPKKCELSKTAIDYALRLCAERLLNAPTQSAIDGLQWMERGKELEPMAVKQYEFQMETTTVAVGFITTDDGSIGCSPDRLVLGDEKIALEVKCPSPHIHLGYLLSGTTDDYKPQVQGQILVAELDRAHLYAYHPQMPPALIETKPHTEYLEKLEDALLRFVDNLDEMHERAIRMGAFQPTLRATSRPEETEMAELKRRFRAENADKMLREGFVA